MKISDLRNTEPKSKKQHFIILGSIIAVVLCVSLCVAFIPDWTSDEEYLSRMQKGLKSNELSVPMRIESKITLTQGNQAFAEYNKSVIIESADKAVYTVKEEYADAPTMNLYEDYILKDATIYLRQKDAENEITNKYAGDIEKFKGIVLAEEDLYQTMTLREEYFKSYKLKRESNTVTLTAEIADGSLADFIQIENAKSVTIKIEATKEGRIISYDLAYVKSETMEMTTKIHKEVSRKPQSIEFPEWIEKID